MTEDEIDILQAKYRRARKAFTEIHSKVEKMGDNLRYISAKLSPPHDSRSYQNQVTPLNERSIQQIREMPSSELVLSTMKVWDDARTAIIDIWEQIPEKDRADFRELPANLKNYNFTRPRR